jgi:hypothetical protein
VRQRLHVHAEERRGTRRLLRIGACGDGLDHDAAGDDHEFAPARILTMDGRQQAALVGAGHRIAARTRTRERHPTDDADHSTIERRDGASEVVRRRERGQAAARIVEHARHHECVDERCAAEIGSGQAHRRDEVADVHRVVRGELDRMAGERGVVDLAKRERGTTRLAEPTRFVARAPRDVDVDRDDARRGRSIPIGHRRRDHHHAIGVDDEAGTLCFEIEFGGGRRVAAQCQAHLDDGGRQCLVQATQRDRVLFEVARDERRG